MKTTQITHYLHYIHRNIPSYKGKKGVCEDYLIPNFVTPETAANEIRESLRYYAPGSAYIIFRVEGTATEPLYLQPLNMQSLDFPEYGPGLRKPLSESLESMVETARLFWKDAKVIPSTATTAQN